MRALRRIYAFVTGGSIAAPVCLACGMIAASIAPHSAAISLAGFVVLALIASVYERPH